MSFSKTNPLVAAGAALAVSLVAASAQQIVYNNTSTSLNSFYGSGAEYGDEIVLAPGLNGVGSQWKATAFDFEYYSNYSLANGAVLRFYANDGGGGAPGTLLYESNPFDIINNGANVHVDLTQGGIVGGGVDVPDHLTFTISLSGGGGANEAGLTVYNPPTVGASGDDFWIHNGATWSLQQLGDGKVANFNARLTAIPEPKTIALAGAGALGWLAMVGYRRLRK
jgi:hypothetical protein